MTNHVETSLAAALDQLQLNAEADVRAFAEAVSLDLARAQGRPELKAEVLAQIRALAEKHRLSASGAVIEAVVGLAFDLLGGSDAQG